MNLPVLSLSGLTRAAVLDSVRALGCGLLFPSLSDKTSWLGLEERRRTIEKIAYFFILECVNHSTEMLAQSHP